MHTVTLNIQKTFLEEILSGIKKVEYRSSTLSLLNKLKKLDSTPFQLRLINGMKKGAPEASVLVTKLWYDEANAMFEFHIDSVISTKFCESLSTDLSVSDYLEVTLPPLELPRDRFNALRDGETDAFVLTNNEESLEYVDTVKQVLPTWIELTCGKSRIEMVLFQVLEDFFQESFELRVLQKTQ